MYLLMAYLAECDDIVRRSGTSVLIIDHMMSFHMIAGTTDLTYVTVTLLSFPLRSYMFAVSF